jgi:hypothetical protein
MPVREEFPRDNVIVLKFSDVTSVDEWQGIAQRCEPYFARANSIVHIIVEASEVTRIPPKMLSFLYSDTTGMRSNPALGIVVIAGASTLLTAIMVAFSKLLPAGKLRFTKTMDQAFALIDQADNLEGSG